MLVNIIKNIIKINNKNNNRMSDQFFKEYKIIKKYQQFFVHD